MSDTTGKVEDSIWPMPQFSFEVDLGSHLPKVHVGKVSGLDIELDASHLPKGNESEFPTVTLTKTIADNTVLLQDCLLPDRAAFERWHDLFLANTLSNCDVLIKLLDEESTTVMAWELKSATTKSVKMSNKRRSKSTGNEVAVDTIEIIHEKLVISNA